MIADIAHLFVISLLISSVTFGGGSQALFYQYGVLQTGWISKTDLSAVLAFGYATPGPAAFGTATFIGYKIGGIGGAVIGTIGIFIVPFLASFLAGKYLKHLLSDPRAKHFVQGIGLAAAGLVAAAAFGVITIETVGVWHIIIAATALVGSLKWNVNPLVILLAGLLVGLILL